MASKAVLVLCALLFCAFACAPLAQADVKTAGVLSLTSVLEEAPKLSYQGGHIHVQDQGLLGEYGVAMTSIVVEPCSIWGPLYIPNAGSLLFVTQGSAKIGMTDAFTPFNPELLNTTQLHEEDVLAVPIGWPFYVMNPNHIELKIVGYHKFSTINPQDLQLQFTYVFGKTFFPNYLPIKAVATTYNVTKARARSFFSKQQQGGMVKLPKAVCAANPVPPRVPGNGPDGTPQGDYILHCGNPSLSLVQFPGIGLSRDCSILTFPELARIGASLVYPTVEANCGVEAHEHYDALEVNYVLKGASTTLLAGPDGKTLLEGDTIEPLGSVTVIPPSFVHQPASLTTEGFSLLSFFNTPAIPVVFFASPFAIYEKTRTFPADIMAAAFGTSVADYTDFFGSNKGTPLGPLNNNPK